MSKVEGSEDELSQFDMQGECCSLQSILKSVFHDNIETYNDIFKCVQFYILGIMSIEEFGETVDEPFEERNAGKEKERLMKLLVSRCSSRRLNTWCCRPSADLIKIDCERFGLLLKLQLFPFS